MKFGLQLEGPELHVMGGDGNHFWSLEDVDKHKYWLDSGTNKQ